MICRYYRVSKHFTFAAAHRLAFPYDGKCSNIHGHTYRVEIVARSQKLDECGMVIDFKRFDFIKRYIDKHLDHALLNGRIAQPTAEHIARHIWEVAKSRKVDVERVRVWESESSWAEYGV